MLHEDMRLFYNGFPRDAHPMAILSSVVSAMSTFYQDSLDPHDPEQVEISIRRLMAKLPTIAAYSHKKSDGQPFVYPQNDLSYCENFLQMMFSVPCEPYDDRPDVCRSAEPAVDRACRSRAELQHLDGPDGGFGRFQFVRLDFRRHLRPLGTAARRCQRSRGLDA